MSTSKKSKKVAVNKPKHTVKATVKAKKSGLKVVAKNLIAPAEPGEGIIEDSDADLDSAVTAPSAMAAPTTPAATESSYSFKNFRHHPEMENFYRFIYENDLRFEALGILDSMVQDKLEKKNLLAAKVKPC